MDPEKALEVGKARAEQVAEAIRRWTGVKASALCAVKPAQGIYRQMQEEWEPVGQQSWNENACDGGIRETDTLSDLSNSI